MTTLPIGHAVMKILIEDAKIITHRKDKPIIDKGYIYINKGVIAAVGEGPPPPEYEFAEYIIDGKGRVVMPGFVVGMPSIMRMSLAYVTKCRENISECLSVLTKDEIKAIVETTATLLAYSGVTSLIVRIENSELTDAIAKAVSEAWIRVRIVFGNEDDLREGVKVAARNVVDQEAIPKGILSFGVFGRHTVSISIDELRSLDAFAYIDSCNEDAAKSLEDRVICINSSILTAKRVVIDTIEMWKGDSGLGFTNPKFVNPHNFLTMLKLQGIEAIEGVKTLSHLNPKYFSIGLSEIREGAPADLIILNFREPPYGPMIFDTLGLYELICDGLYGVETVIIGGELVIDRFEPLMVGKKVFNVVLRVNEDLSKS